MIEAYIDTWQVEAVRTDGYVVTCYGLPSEAVARRIGSELSALSVETIRIVRLRKRTSKSRWETHSFIM